MKKIRALLYCTKAKPYLVKRNIFAGIEPSYFTLEENVEDNLNGTIVAECEIEVEEIKKGWGCLIGTRYYRKSSGYPDYELEQKSCLSFDKMNEYLNGTLNEKSGYALHISNLKVFDKPRYLDEYWNYDSEGLPYKITKAPQNMCKAHKPIFLEIENYVLISIKPQWLCKILNGEKTIEVRKQVLNCMKGE